MGLRWGGAGASSTGEQRPSLDGGGPPYNPPLIPVDTIPAELIQAMHDKDVELDSWVFLDEVQLNIVELKKTFDEEIKSRLHIEAIKFYEVAVVSDDHYVKIQLVKGQVDIKRKKE